MLPKIHKRLSAVSGGPAISNCGTLTGKASKFVDFHLKPIIKCFINKIKSLYNMPSNLVLVKTDAVDLYLSIPHEPGLDAIKEALGNRERKSIPTRIYLKCFSLY